MGKFTGYLLASDFDDTLVATTHLAAQGIPMRDISPENYEALRYFIAEGGIFTVSTGRSAATFAPFADKIPMNAPVIVSGGAALYDYGAEAFQYVSYLPARSREDLFALADRFPEAALELYHEDAVVQLVHPNRHSREHEDTTGTVLHPVSSADEVDFPLHKALFEADADILTAIAEEMRRTGLDAWYELTFSTPEMLELTEKGIDKGTSLLRLASLLGVAPEGLCAVGDQSNDLPMLRAAVHAFAPENASENVRALPGIEIVCAAKDGAISAVISALETRLSTICPK